MAMAYDVCGNYVKSVSANQLCCCYWRSVFSLLHRKHFLKKRLGVWHLGCEFVRRINEGGNCYENDCPVFDY